MTSYVSFEMAYQNVLKSVQQKFSLVAYIVSCIRISEQDFWCWWLTATDFR